MGIPGAIQPNGAGLLEHGESDVKSREGILKVGTVHSQALCYIMLTFPAVYQSLDRSKLALVRGLLADKIKESSVDMIGQISSL